MVWMMSNWLSDSFPPAFALIVSTRFAALYVPAGAMALAASASLFPFVSLTVL